MELETIKTDLAEVAVFQCSGDMDGEGPMGQLRDAFNDARLAGQHQVILDMASVNHIGYRCIGILVEESIDFRADGGDLKLAALTDVVRDIFRVTGADRAFDIYDTMEAAKTTLPLETSGA